MQKLNTMFTETKELLRICYIIFSFPLRIWTNIFEKFSNLCFTTLCFILLNFVQNFLNSYFPSTFIFDKEEKTCPYFFHKSLTSICTFILVWLFITWFAWVSFILLVVGAITCTVFPSLLIFYFFNFIYLTLSFFRTTCTYI